MDVYKGTSLAVEWRHLLEIAVRAGFSHSNGELLLHISDALIPWHVSVRYMYNVWYFHPLNPWQSRFDGRLHLAFDAGLRYEWVRRATDRLVAKFRTTSEHLPLAEGGDDARRQKITLENIYGVNVFCLIAVGVAVVTFVGEVLTAKLPRKDAEEKGIPLTTHHSYVKM